MLTDYIYKNKYCEIIYLFLQVWTISISDFIKK